MTWPASDYVHDDADEIAEIIVDHYRETSDDKALFVERIEDLVATIGRYPEVFGRRLAHELKRQIPRLRREAGLCPQCGGELQDLRWHEVHPYGATVALEPRSMTVCPVHGEVD